MGLRGGRGRAPDGVDRGMIGHRGGHAAFEALDMNLNKAVGGVVVDTALLPNVEVAGGLVG